LVEEIGVPEKSTDMPQVTDNFIAHSSEVYSIVDTTVCDKVVSYLRHVGAFLRYSDFLHQ
jgi:hypothetical protein